MGAIKEGGIEGKTHVEPQTEGNEYRNGNACGVAVEESRPWTLRMCVCRRTEIRVILSVTQQSICLLVFPAVSDKAAAVRVLYPASAQFNFCLAHMEQGVKLRHV